MQYIEGKSRKQCVLFPQALDEIIDENNDVRFIDLFAESIDIGSFSFTNCDNILPSFDKGQQLASH